ncbi:hypothetical protein [Polyangium sorediatum]|uniref:Uncharacterized protein n=1 Tax=Polyangium sorediatum TaxID=889274 RepID=A0ABT6NIS1_9BACT|nr:hypothetical protein [Polyangium sorediatum]MDI1428201.1 hypothetical protein [Polyangium sorediatum]
MPRAAALVPLLCLSLLLILAPARALAGDEPNRVAFRFDYTPPRTIRGCMGRDDFIMWLASGFGFPVVRDDARALVRVELKRKGREIEAHVSALDEHGAERWNAVIPTPLDCRELVQDAAYAIALNLGRWELQKQPAPEWLLLRPQIEVGLSAPSPSLRSFIAYDDDGPLRRRTPDPFYEVTTVPAPPTNPTESQGPKWELGAAGLFAPYGLPRIGFGGSAAVSVTWSRFSLGGEVRVLASLVQENIDPEQTLLLSGLVVPCLETSWSFAACAPISVGRAAYLGEGATYVESDALAVSLGPRFAYNFKVTERLRLRPFVEALFAVGGNPLTVKLQNGDTRVHQPLAPVFVHAGIVVLIDVQ